MIKNYSDHAANERTYLAWVRTSIAIMAFGFLIERFEIFIVYVGKVIEDEQHFQSSFSAELVGLGLFLVGLLIMVTATWRFFMHKEAIELDETISYNVKRTNILLSALIILIAVFLLFYMGNQILI
ncbi:MAG: DUF202 domain-containing protein, partial [Campylobacterota bacterium]|nr:DUF202 domain-containing protein [Campylobacterota bacterium]